MNKFLNHYLTEILVILLTIFLTFLYTKGTLNEQAMLILYGLSTMFFANKALDQSIDRLVLQSYVVICLCILVCALFLFYHNRTILSIITILNFAFLVYFAFKSSKLDQSKAFYRSFIIKHLLVGSLCSILL